MEALSTFKPNSNDPSTPLHFTDDSYRMQSINGGGELVICHALCEYIELPVGTWCMYDGERYELFKPQHFKKISSQHYEYTLVFETISQRAKKYIFKNPIDHRLQFSLTAKPREHLQMLIDNLNARDTGWAIGNCMEADEKPISYNQVSCMDALKQMADHFATEYEFDGKTVSLHKVEHYKTAPLELSYGKDKGIKPELTRDINDHIPVETLHVLGGERNIDKSKYGSKTLLLPKYQHIRFDGEHFEGETGFQLANARSYITDPEGRTINRNGAQTITGMELCFDGSELFPQRTGGVSQVIVVNPDKNEYDFIDQSIPAALNYANCLIAGQSITIAFQSGMLAGREFEANYYHDPITIGGVSKLGRRFKIFPKTIDGETMPNDTYKPAVGDRYAVFNIALPNAHISNNTTKTGASWDLFRSAVRYFYEHEDLMGAFKIDLDPIFLRKHWDTLKPKLKTGGYILLKDDQFDPNGTPIRITGIKDSLRNPYHKTLELSNDIVVGDLFGRIKRQKLDRNAINPSEKQTADLSGVNRRIDQATETITTLQTDITGTKTVVSTLQNNLTTVQANVSLLDYIKNILKKNTRNNAPTAAIEIDGVIGMLNPNGDYTAGFAGGAFAQENNTPAFFTGAKQQANYYAWMRQDGLILYTETDSPQTGDKVCNSTGSGVSSVGYVEGMSILVNNIGNFNRHAASDFAIERPALLNAKTAPFQLHTDGRCIAENIENNGIRKTRFRRVQLTPNDFNGALDLEHSSCFSVGSTANFGIKLDYNTDHEGCHCLIHNNSNHDCIVALQRSNAADETQLILQNKILDLVNINGYWFAKVVGK